MCFTHNVQSPPASKYTDVNTDHWALRSYPRDPTKHNSLPESLPGAFENGRLKSIFKMQAVVDLSFP